MSKNTRSAIGERFGTFLNKTGNLINNSIVGGVIGGVILLLIEYRSGLFQASEENSNHSISLLWSIIAAYTTAAIIISFVNSVRIYFNSQKYFREEFSFAALSTIIVLIFGLAVSVAGRLMFWHPLEAAVYILSSQTPSVTQPSWEGYALLIVSIIAFWSLASIRHQNWNGLRSVQQRQRDQRSELSGIFLEGIGELIRILKREGALERYSELDSTQSLAPLEQSEDFISHAWKEQARELLKLSCSSYVIDQESGWHDKQGCWLGQNTDTGTLFFLYPAQSVLSKKDLDAFIDYSEGIAKSQNCQISEFIVAFREDRDKLATLTNSHENIRFETEQNLLEKLVNFTDYHNSIRKRILLNKLPDSELVLNDVYVASQFILSEEERLNNVDDNVENYLRKWLDEPGQRQIALLGEYGQGKSSTALMFAYRLLFKSEKPAKRIPILIELRGKSPRNLTPLGLLGDWASQYRIEPQALMRLHIAGRLVLIFEGFDEMALIGNSELRIRHFRTLWRFCYPNAKIIITGRPNFFLDDIEMKTALGIVKPISDKPYCEAIRLAPFTVEQIREALREQKSLVRDQICSFAKSGTRFRELVSRPSSLHVVSVLWEREKLYEKTELLDSAYVMERFVRSSYRRQGRKAQSSNEFMALNSSERDYFMCGIASYMAAKELSNQITNEQLNELIDDLINVIPDSVSTSPPEIFGEDTRPLRQRIKEPKDDVEHIRTDVRTCGLLVDDTSAPGTFKFGHKSFMEYLFATTVKEYIWDLALEKAKAIRKVTRFPIEAILELPVSVGFLAEMIGNDTSATSNNVRFGGEITVATTLLEVIFSLRKNSILWPTFRFSLFNYSYVKSGAKFKGIKRNLIIFSRVLLLIAILSLLTFPLSRFHFQQVRSNYFLIILTVSLVFTYSYFASSIIVFSPTLSRKLRLWNSICKELQIDDKVLHQITGTRWLPWARHKPFDYFLNQAPSGENDIKSSN